jgi:tripartite-type tricarboxylate transporter receptor subunit TctC
MNLLLLFRPLLGLAALVSSLSLFAQGFPERPITMVVPFPPGGTTDILARTIAERMTRELKQPVVVENRSGAGGNTGAELVAKAKPDGHTLLLSAAGPLSINHHLYAKQGYDPLRDFAPVSLVASVPIMLVSHPQRPFQNLNELIAYAKANPGKLSYGSQGNGTTSHLTMELLKRRAGLQITHIPYRGSAPASTDLMAGQIDLMFDNSPSTLPHVQSQKMRGLAVASKARVSSMETLPTVAEAVSGFESTAWFGIVAPARTPDGIIAVLNRIIDQALRQPEVKDKLAASGVDLVGGPAADLGKYMRDESEKWFEIIKSLGLKLD